MPLPQLLHYYTEGLKFPQASEKEKAASTPVPAEGGLSFREETVNRLSDTPGAGNICNDVWRMAGGGQNQDLTYAYFLPST